MLVKPSQLWSNLVKRVTYLYYLVRVITGRRPDGGIPLVYEDQERTRGYGDHHRYDQDQVSSIPAKGRGPSVVEMGEDL